MARRHDGEGWGEGGGQRDGLGCGCSADDAYLNSRDAGPDDDEEGGEEDGLGSCSELREHGLASNDLCEESTSEACMHCLYQALDVT